MPLYWGHRVRAKQSALLIPTLRSWQGTALVVDISGDISANVNTPNKIVFDPTSENCIPYDVFASINAVTDETERQERLEQLAYLLLPDKANDSEAGIFFYKEWPKNDNGSAYLLLWHGLGLCGNLRVFSRSRLAQLAERYCKAGELRIANMFISSFAGASEQNTAGCKQAADDAFKLFATNDKIKNALRKVPSYEKSICPATLETRIAFIFSSRMKSSKSMATCCALLRRSRWNIFHPDRRNTSR